MRRAAIIHFRPIELYPPVMNWINYLAAQDDGMEILVFTMGTTVVREFKPASPLIKIVRPARDKKGGGPLHRYWSYFRFYAVVTAKLVSWKPDTVLYYETLSSLPAILYKKAFGKGSRLLIHYHEYMDPADYERGMLLDRVLHKFEKKIYPLCAWVSHTNEYRLRYFLDDNKMLPPSYARVLPNFPPKSWVSVAPKSMNEPLKLVHAGSLSLQAMFIKEIAKWVIAQDGKVVLDIYSLLITEETRQYLSGLNTDLVRYLGGCSYDDLPSVLAGYDVGVVLYKGLNDNKNTIYAASNKVFEYLACGLDVWYSKEMAGTYAYNTFGVFPKIIPVDFSKLEEFDVRAAIDRKECGFRPSPYFCEEVFISLHEVFKQDIVKD